MFDYFSRTPGWKLEQRRKRGRVHGSSLFWRVRRGVSLKKEGQ